MRMEKKDIKKILKKTWYFIWEDDSLLSWIVNIILAYILIKFIVYPALGFLLSTSHPVVAVVSSSMEHNSNFDNWWNSNEQYYNSIDITKQDFIKYSFKNGFNKGDIMVLKGVNPEKIETGNVIVYTIGSKDPIIHRVVKKWYNNSYYFQTKGDNVAIVQNFEKNINEKQLIGKALFRIPYLGYIKIWFVELLKFIGIA